MEIVLASVAFVTSALLHSFVAFLPPDLDEKWIDGPTMILMTGSVAILLVLFIAGKFLKRQPESIVDPAVVRALDRRISAWLLFMAMLAVVIFLERSATIVFFGLVSFWALREFITMAPTRKADHRALTWTFFLFTPLQYTLVWLGLFDLYTIMIPVFASLFIPARIAFTGDSKRFLERTAKIQFGLLICVYAISYAPAILDMDLKCYDLDANGWMQWKGSKAGLLVYFVVIVQLSDAFQFLWNKLLGKHPIAPEINSTKTWEGLIGGSLCVAVVGALLSLLGKNIGGAWHGVTPFLVQGAGATCLIISIAGTCGSMVMSAIKRDRGVTDYGTLIQGHAGVLDRMDSFSFAAPIFFHVTLFWLNITTL